MINSTYKAAQIAMASLKAAVREEVANAGADGITNAVLGRKLGIYTGHKGHDGHISRTLLGILESEGVVTQDQASKLWTLVE